MLNLNYTEEEIREILPALTDGERAEFDRLLCEPAKAVTPQNDSQLKAYLLDTFGAVLPDTKVCPEHSTPFRAFADAFFARSTVSVWKASRGFGGKSYLLSLLGATEASTLHADVTILGGSGEQSTRVHDYMAGFFSRLGYDESTKRETQLPSGGRVRALMASTKSVRGPHPQRLRIDEADEIDIRLIDAALGQPMSKGSVAKQTVFSSTHQYPDAAMTELLRRAAENSWTVHEWCIAEGQRVTTLRGEVPIEKLAAGDLVMTRKGWRRVKHVTRMGVRRTVKIRSACGRELVCTPDHKVATDSGWVEAARLVPSLHELISTSAAFFMAAVGSDVDVFARKQMPLRAVRRARLESPSAARVLPRRHRFEMTEVDASTIPAEVIYVPSGRYWAFRFEPDPKMCLSTRPLTTSLDTLESVTVATCAGPLNAGRFHAHHSIIGVEECGEFPVWDIGVEGEHEFCVEGFIAHNCWRETSAPDGWLTQSEIDSKRAEVTAAMWAAEYDLQEPSPEGRAILPEKVDACFRKELGEAEGRLGEYLEFEAPVKGAAYATGADWAKKKDYTIIDTLRTDVRPMRRVAWIRLGRMPWPMMIAKFNERVARYPGQACHDATGIGDVVGDYQTANAEGVILTGQTRGDAFTAYIAAIEGEAIESPKIRYCEGEHRYCTNDDLGGSGHPPDSFVAGAMAYRAAQPKPVKKLVFA